FANEHPDAGPNNERLEFLGDAVLGLLAAQILHETLASAPEGVLTQRRALVVRQTALADMARRIELGSALRLGHGQAQDASGPNESVLANGYEAVVGAVFVDGGYAAVQQCFQASMAAAIQQSTEPLDFKTQLQETCHRRQLPAPRYRVMEVNGPDHARRYACEVEVGTIAHGCGEGSSKKAAEQECARLALEALGGDHTHAPST
ncbi:MAG: ribonuclease III, partial [Myxococcota bacterium]